jgi:hypothetical protein
MVGGRERMPLDPADAAKTTLDSFLLCEYIVITSFGDQS